MMARCSFVTCGGKGGRLAPVIRQAKRSAVTTQIVTPIDQ
jgi:hypothetical protein